MKTPTQAQRKVPKSEWVRLCLETDGHKAAVRSWFSPLCDDMTPTKAELLVDIDTDREKKVRVWMDDTQGRERQAVRTRTRSGWTITLKALTDLGRAAIASKEQGNG